MNNKDEINHPCYEQQHLASDSGAGFASKIFI